MVKRSVCPPGVWCLTPSIGIVFIILLAFLGGFYYLNSSSSLLSSSTMPKMKRPIQVINNIAPGGGDDRYTRAPEPLRFWQTGPDLRGGLVPPGAVPINVPTRGLPQAYQQMGIIKSGDQILPLYGRQTAYRSDRYNYYTRTDTYNPVQLPIRFERKDCMDSIGCSEMFGGENINVAGLGKEGKVEIYKFDGPTYIPGLV